MFFLKLSFGVGFDSLDNQTNKLCLHYTAYSTHYTVYYTDHSLVYQEQWEGKDKIENWFEFLTLIVQHWVLKISFTHSFGLGFANHVYQTNKLKTVHTLQCTLNTVHYVPYPSEFNTLDFHKQNKNCTYVKVYTVHSTLCTTQTRVQYTWNKQRGRTYRSIAYVTN